jgi:hypothetical protein
MTLFMRAQLQRIFMEIGTTTVLVELYLKVGDGMKG